MKVRALIAAAAWAVCAAWTLPVLPAEEKPFTGELQLILRHAVFRGEKQEEQSPHLVLDLEAKEGQWERVWGYALSYGHGVSSGWVRDAEMTGDSLKLKLAIRVGGDAYTKNGRGYYDVELRRGPDGRYTGKYTGTYEDAPAAGPADATLKPPRPPIPADFVPVQPGEHPRVLFRKKDLPELRKKFNTPFGQRFEAVTRAGRDPIALGVLYQLTGQKDYALDAIPFVLKELADQDPQGLGQVWGPRMCNIALTYDLCYDVWPEALRKDVDSYLLWMTDRCLRFTSSLSAMCNDHQCSNYSGPMRGGGAIGTLVIWGDKGPEPQPPHDPGTEPVSIAPVKDFAPVKGVPIFIFRPDERPLKWRTGAGPSQRPLDWVWAGPLPLIAKDDVLAAAGGYAQARPAPGMTVLYKPAGGGEACQITFRRPDETPQAEPVVAEKPLTAQEKQMLAIRTFYEDTFRPLKTNLLFCYVRVPAPQVLRFNKDPGPTRAWFNGVEVFHEDYVRVQEGVYPLLVQHYYGSPFDGYSVEFVPVPEEDVKKEFAKRRKKYKMDFEDYQENHTLWKNSGGVDPRRENLLGLGREHMYVSYRVMMGNGGFQTEGEAYTCIAADCPLQYAVAYRKMFGRDVSPYPDVTHFVPRYLTQAVFPGDQKEIGGKDICVPINGPNMGVGVFRLSKGFPIVPDHLKPGVLWAWNRLTHTDPAKIGTAQGFTNSTLFEGWGNAPEYTFLHYPLDMQPQHPSECFENTWAADTKGLYVFRNGWKGTDDIVFQFLMKTQRGKGHNQPSAGTFNLQGLGHAWASNYDGKDGPRWKQNVVMFPEDLERVCDHETGIRTYYHAEKDGSGAATVNLDFLYSGGKPFVHKGEVSRPTLNDQQGLPLPELLNPDGIKGLRSVAVDYGGKCGAPMLLAIVDQITGGGPRWWLWMMPQKFSGGVRCERNTFTITQDGITLKATFVSPGEVKIEEPGKNTYKEEKKTTVEVGGRKRQETKTEVLPLDSIVAKGAGHFFVIVTLQKGPAPEVRIEGQGLDAKITVGQRKVSFDGQKVVFGE